MNLDYDIAIVGAGAAGLAAAIFAAQECGDARVVLLDGAKKIGAKILVSGGGRCNVTNEKVTANDFNGQKSVVRHVLGSFNHRRAIEWFESLGINLKLENTGKLFPVSDKASTVLNALIQRCHALRVDIRPQHRVTSIHQNSDIPDRPHFTIEHSQGTTTAPCLIMATGGRSLPRTGSDGGGWGIVRALGHTVTATFPALAPLVLDSSMFHQSLAGLAMDVGLSTSVDGKLIDRRTGSLLWTHFGVSGPVVMDASRFWLIAQADSYSSPRLACSFLPDGDFAKVEQWLVDRSGASPKRSIVNVLAERFTKRFAEAILKHDRVPLDSVMAHLSRDHRRTIVHSLIDLELPVQRDRGWNYAEVTAGGVPLDEIDRRTMESKRVSGLFLTGEMLDCDGRIGGFNFQWAWATGHMAGRAAAQHIRNKT